MISPVRLRLKIFTSFAIALLGAVVIVRLAASVPLSGATALAFATGALFVAAGVWRGLIYIQAARRGGSTAR
jgi:hypothetical protein